VVGNATAAGLNPVGTGIAVLRSLDNENSETVRRQYESNKHSGSPNTDETAAPPGVPAESSLPTGVSAMDTFRRKNYGGGF
jgi:hypothetical protein